MFWLLVYLFVYPTGYKFLVAFGGDLLVCRFRAVNMGRFADVIRCHILEKYMSSYMRERNVDALLVLRNEDKWAMTGNFLYSFA